MFWLVWFWLFGLGMSSDYEPIRAVSFWLFLVGVLPLLHQLIKIVGGEFRRR